MRGNGSIRVLAVGVDPAGLEGASVDSADDLLGAIARLADGGIDVVVLSLELPDGGGVDAVRAVRERAPDVPVIAVTERDQAERAIDAGASDVVPPDADPDLLARAIRYATSLQRIVEESRRHQIVDELTGLYNARGFEQLASHHVAVADRDKRPIVLVFVSLQGLDELDEVEDAAERAGWLAEAARVLRAAVRESDVIARVGDGAFCILLTGDASGAESLVLSRLVEAIAASNARSGRARQLALSVGAAAYDPENPVTLDELIAQADRRMREHREAT